MTQPRVADYAPPVAQICQTFHERAVATWLDIATGHAIGLIPGEESITDYHLLHIQREHPFEIRAHRYSKWKESRSSGADWEWWFGGHSAWTALRIQAKKIDYEAQTFPGLDRTSWRKRQVDRLIDSSADDNVSPWYCFYTSRPEREESYECRCGAVLPSSFVRGCSLLPAGHVRHLIDERRSGFLDIIPGSVPWSCLLCCPRWRGSGDPLVDRVRSYISVALRESGYELSDSDYEPPPIVEYPPDYVRALLGDEEAGSSVTSNPPAHISSVLVVRDDGEFPPSAPWSGNSRSEIYSKFWEKGHGHHTVRPQ